MQIKKGRTIGGLLLSGLLIWIVSRLDIDWQEVIRIILTIDPLFICVGYLLMFGVFFCAALRWMLVVKELDTLARNRSYFYFLRYAVLGGVSEILFLGALGNIGVKSMALKIDGQVPLTKGTYSVLFDQLITLLINTFFLIPACLFLAKMISLAQGVWLAATLLLLFFLLFWVCNRFMIGSVMWLYSVALQALAFLPFAKNRLPEQATRKDQFAISRAASLKVFLVAIMKYFLLAAFSFTVALAVGISLPFSIFLLSEGAVMTLVTFPILPGNVGVSEAGWYGVLSLVGISSQASLMAFMITSRLLFNLSVLLVGFTVWLIHFLCFREERESAELRL
ncbi:MAG: flippase-like domain-containing protein [Proteobacteria bacterium]|nr:flippase-like domain-containing protein [Pseudomonadota bacterium]MBU4296671.1 flippase-like domain-containing protein [Pseudomonadota bacterium]MCG2748464.1 flippase-like domain-containing protein [Desulfobulbaceae bacterium]